MKRGLLFLGFTLFVLVTVYAQSLSLSWTGGALTNGQVITITGDTTGTVYSYLYCTNNNTDTLSVKVKKKEISLVAGSENSFCWLNCYLPSTYISTYSIDILPDSTSLDFIGEYKAHGNIGISSIMYTFFDMNNVNDSVSVIVNYDCSLGSSVQEIKNDKIVFSNAYPNPANSYTSFSYTFPPASAYSHQFVIRDLLGNMVYESEITDQTGIIKVYTNSFSNGVYFYSLLVDGQAYFTRKLIVKH